MKTFYIAASFPRKQVAIQLEKRLQEAGLKSVSRWLHLESEGYAKGVDKMADEISLIDLEDVIEADILICLTGDTLTRGGRHSEFGIAACYRHLEERAILNDGMASEKYKRLIIVGPREQVFHNLPYAEIVSDVEWLMRLLVPGRPVQA